MNRRTTFKKKTVSFTTDANRIKLSGIEQRTYLTLGGLRAIVLQVKLAGIRVPIRLEEQGATPRQQIINIFMSYV